MNYWVNEDKPTNKATIHKGTRCGPQEKNPRDGQWHPAEDKASAYSIARDTGRAVVRECLVCKP
jgi:hypothetical protein